MDRPGEEAFGTYVAQLLSDNLSTVNSALNREAGMHRQKRRSLNVAGVARLLHTNRARLRRMLDNQEPWSADDVRELVRILKLSDADAEALERRRRRSMRKESGESTPELPRGDSESKGMYMLNRWTRDMPLLPENLVVTRVERSTEPAGAKLVGEQPSVKGVVAVPFRVGELDWNEAPDQNVFHVEVAEAAYAATLATRRTFTSNNDLKQQLVDRAADGDVAGVIELAPYSLIAANINLVTADGWFVLAKRSSIVLMNKNEWNVGINESMKISPPGEATENFFDLARRGLREELAIPEDSIDLLTVNWFGYCTTCCNFYVNAHARTTLSVEEVQRERHRARDVREFAAVVFQRLTPGALTTVVEGRPMPGEPDTRWLHHAALSAHLLWTEMYSFVQ